MSLGNLNTEGQKRNNFPWQQYMIRLLTSIDNNTAAIVGDNEIVKTAYEAIAPGPGYSIGDNIIRLDIINATTGALVNTLWFNENTQAFIAAPAPGNLVPATAPSDVTVTNAFNLESTQALIKAVLDSINTKIVIDADDDNIADEQTLPTDINLLYGYNDGDNLWERVHTDDFNRLKVSQDSQPLPLGAATEATLSTVNGKLVDGNDIGDVTVNNGAGAAAVNIQDGGNSITVDGTVNAVENPIEAEDGIIPTNLNVPVKAAILYAEGDGVNVRLKTDYSVDSRLLTSSTITGTVPLPTGAATEATLLTIDADTGTLATPVTGLPVSMRRTSGPDSVPAGMRRVSFFNAGNSNATVLGAALLPGEQVTFSADGLRDTLAAFPLVDGTGTDLLITHVG